MLLRRASLDIRADKSAPGRVRAGSAVMRSRLPKQAAEALGTAGLAASGGDVELLASRRPQYPGLRVASSW